MPNSERRKSRPLSLFALIRIVVESKSPEAIRSMEEVMSGWLCTDHNADPAHRLKRKFAEFIRTRRRCYASTTYAVLIRRDWILLPLARLNLQVRSDLLGAAGVSNQVLNCRRSVDVTDYHKAAARVNARPHQLAKLKLWRLVHFRADDTRRDASSSSPASRSRQTFRPSSLPASR